MWYCKSEAYQRAARLEKSAQHALRGSLRHMKCSFTRSMARCPLPAGHDSFTRIELIVKSSIACTASKMTLEQEAVATRRAALSRRYSCCVENFTCAYPSKPTPTNCPDPSPSAFDVRSMHSLLLNPSH